MKRYLFIIVTVVCALALVGCGSKKDERTMGDIITAFTDNGVNVDSEEKPLFELIGAKDGVIFKIDDEIVKIYEFETEKALREAKEENTEMMGNWPSNGKFLLESYSEKGTEIFNGIAQ